MQIIACDHPFIATGFECQAFTRYVCTSQTTTDLINAMGQLGRRPRTLSNFNSYERKYAGQDLNDKVLMIYRQGALGDQLQLTSLTERIKSLYPRGRIFVVTGIGVDDIWLYNPTMEHLRCVPTLEFVKNCDYHLMLEGMQENDVEVDQENVYDSMFANLGMECPDDFKRPFIYLGDQDNQLRNEWHQNRPLGQYVVYQFSPSIESRMYPWSLGYQAIAGLQKAGYRVVLVGQSKVIPEAPHGTLNLINRTKRFREMVPIVREAACVVCPDSSMGHLTAAFPEVPAVSLWGPFSPDCRVKHYTNHHPLWPRAVCPYSPCFVNAPKLPVERCSYAENHIAALEACNVLRAITPESIVEKVREVAR